MALRLYKVKPTVRLRWLLLGSTIESRTAVADGGGAPPTWADCAILEMANCPSNLTFDPRAPRTHGARRTVGNWSLRIGVCAVMMLGVARGARADSLYIAGIERPDATVKEIRGDTLVYEWNGKMAQVPVSKVTRVTVPSESPLTGAESAYAQGKWDEAVDAYQKTMRTTAKPWVKEWAALRLIDAAQKSGRFDAAVSAYIITLLRDPAAAEKLKPEMPDAKSTYLDTAVADVNQALNEPRLSVEQQRALLSYLAELQQTRNNAPGVDAAYQRLAKLPGADANDPAAQRVVAGRKIASARQALDAGNYQQAITEIEAVRPALADSPAQNAEALWIVAEARYAIAQNDPTALKDAGLAYMRIPALTSAGAAGSIPHLVESLLKTATIMEQLGEPQTALKLNQQIVAQYPDDPATPRAKENLKRLTQQASKSPNNN